VDPHSWRVTKWKKYFFQIFSKNDQNIFEAKYLLNYSESREQPQTSLGSFEALNKNMQKKSWEGWVDFEVQRVLTSLQQKVIMKSKSHPISQNLSNLLGTFFAYSCSTPQNTRKGFGLFIPISLWYILL